MLSLAKAQPLEFQYLHLFILLTHLYECMLDLQYSIYKIFMEFALLPIDGLILKKYTLRYSFTIYIIA